jgi:hypothetical protein
MYACMCIPSFYLIYPLFRALTYMQMLIFICIYIYIYIGPLLESCGVTKKAPLRNMMMQLLKCCNHPYLIYEHEDSGIYLYILLFQCGRGYHLTNCFYFYFRPSPSLTTSLPSHLLYVSVS